MRMKRGDQGSVEARSSTISETLVWPDRTLRARRVFAASMPPM
nr:hypothetical protein [Spongiactinospora rosea]